MLIHDLVLLLPLLLVASLMPADGGDHPPVGKRASPPESTAQRFLDALAAEDWAAAARLVDEEALRECYDGWLAFKPAAFPSLTPEDLVRHDPDMPREVAAWTVERQRRDREAYEHGLSLWFPGVESPDDLRRLEPVEAMARYFGAQDPRARVRRMEAHWKGRMGKLVASGPQPTGGVVLGVVPLGDGLAYAVYAEPGDTSDTSDTAAPMASAPGTLALRKTEDWRILPIGTAFVGMPGPCGGPGADALGRAAWRAELGFDALSRAARRAEPGAGAGAAETVRRLAEALEEKDWRAAAALAEPERLREWHRRRIERAERETRPSRTAEDYMRLDPEMPEAVAHYQVEQQRMALVEFRSMRSPFERLSPVELSALAPGDAMALFLEAVDPEAQVRRYFQEFDPGMLDELIAVAGETALASFVRVHVIGEVVTDRTAYVLYFRGPATPEAPGEVEPLPTDPSVAVLHRTGDGWRVDPEDALFTFAENLSVVRSIDARGG